MPLFKTSMQKLCLSIFIFWLHGPMVMCSVSTNLTNYKQFCLYISSLVIFCERSLSKEKKKVSFLFKSGFCCYLGIAFTTLGNFPVLTNWRRCQGAKVQIFPGYERHSFIFDCWWWKMVKHQEGCASFTWRLHSQRI